MKILYKVHYNVLPENCAEIAEMSNGWITPGIQIFSCFLNTYIFSYKEKAPFSPDVFDPNSRGFQPSLLIPDSRLSGRCDGVARGIGGIAPVGFSERVSRAKSQTGKVNPLWSLGLLSKLLSPALLSLWVLFQLCFSSSSSRQLA